MPPPQADTCASVQTPPGRGAIAVVTVTGSRTSQILEQVFRPVKARPTDAGSLQLGHILDDGVIVDEAIVCKVPGGAEINIHGGAGVVEKLLQVLAKAGASVTFGSADFLPIRHLRLNNPTIGAELLEALPRARSELAARALCFQWSGGISELASGSATADDLRKAATGLSIMHRLLQPAEVVIAGPPNAGKSSLMNLLVGRRVSIVLDSPGATRDWLRESAVLNGIAVWLTDTAGIWAAPPGTDAEAVHRARLRVSQADLVLLLGCADTDLPPWCPVDRVLRIAAKCDLCPPAGAWDVAVSSETMEGLHALKLAVLDRLHLADFDPMQPRAFTQRQAELLLAAANAMDRNDHAAARACLQKLLMERDSHPW